MKLKDILVSFVKKIILSFVFSIIIYCIIDNYADINITLNGYTLQFLDLFLICFSITFIYVLSEGIYFFFKNKTYKSNVDYYRELPRDYSPSMVSFLMNLKTEYKKDILADLIFLEERKIIKIDDNQNIIIISKNTNFKDYEKHLSLLMDVIAKKNNPTINDLINMDDLFFLKEYKETIIYDLRILKLIEDYSSKSALKKVLFVLIFIVVILSIIIFIFVKMSILDKLICILFLLIPIMGMLMVVFSFVSKLITFYNKIIGKNFMRSKFGKDDVNLWLSYDRFIRDFSVMEERSLEEKKLWGYYFAYGLSLGINKKVMKKFNLEYEKYIIK